MQNYPNPFNPSTTIRYDLPDQVHVTLKLYNMLGEEIAILVDELQQSGRKSIEYSAKGLSSGVYFYSLRAGHLVENRKFLLLK